MKYSKQLSVSKTEGEWELINKRVAESGKKSLNSYIRCEAIKIKNAYQIDPANITSANGIKIEKRPCIPNSIHEELTIIARVMKIPVSTLIDRFIIDPMLLPKV